MKIEPDIQLHCQLLGYEPVITGNLSLNSGDIFADLYSYGKYISLPKSGYLSFTCENLKIVTFAHQWDRGPGSTSSYRRTVWHTRIEASVAVLGQNDWKPEYSIATARFIVRDPQRALSSNELETIVFANEVDGIPALFSTGTHEFGGDIEARIVDRRHSNVLSSVGSRITVKIHSFSRQGFGSNDDFGGSVEISFHHPKNLDEYMDEVTNFTSLLALSQGSRSRPYNITITSPDAPSDQTTDGEEHESSFEVRYLWGDESEKKSESKAVQRPILSARTAENRAEFQEAATHWLKRDLTWSRAHHLSAAQTLHGNTFGRDRLFSAFAWLEAIPSDRASKLVSRSTLKAIQAAADKAAKDLGVISARSVIGDALRTINQESKKRRLSRYVDQMLAVDIPRADMSHFRDDCLGAWALRGKLIHGSAMDGEYDFPDAVDFIQAVELLAAFLTLRNLGLKDQEVLSRLRHHELGRYISPYRGRRKQNAGG